VSSGLRGASGTAFGEDGFGFFEGVGHTLGLGRHALFDHGADGFLVGGEPVLWSGLGFEEVEGVGQQFIRPGVRTGLQLALEAGFGGGIENERHAESITPGPEMGAGAGGERRSPRHKRVWRDVPTLPINANIAAIPNARQ